MATISLEEAMINSATVSTDPIERHIVAYLQRARYQNKRLRDHIAKTGAWAGLKNVELWKPFDFFHYFCTKYQERYGVEYRQTGNVFVVYKRIDEFRLSNNISKQDFKEFIDRALNNHFNKINKPIIGHMFSTALYSNLMGADVSATAASLRAVDYELTKDAERFEEYMRTYQARE